MPKILYLLLAAAVSLAAAPVTAQGVGSLSDGSLAMGETVEETPNILSPTSPEDVTAENIGDWILECVKSGPEPRPCRLYQLMKDDAGNSVAEITLYKLATPAGGAVAGATIVVPLETMLTAQLTVAVDGANAKRYPFAFCNQIGCFSRIGLSQEDIDGYKAGTKAEMIIVPAAAPNQIVKVNMSLSGFTKAFDNATGVIE